MRTAFVFLKSVLIMLNRPLDQTTLASWQ